MPSTFSWSPVVGLRRQNTPGLQSWCKHSFERRFKGFRSDRENSLRCCSASSSAGDSPQLTVKLRRARREDAAEIAELCCEAFPYFGLPQRLFGGVLRVVFPPRTAPDWQRQFERAIDVKSDAIKARQRQRAEGQVAYVGAAVLGGRQPEGDRQYYFRNYLRRGFHCLVAEDAVSGEVLGTMAMSLARPQALLPPPFPTSARLQLYVSNVAVRQDVRRRGVATSLLRASERLAARWGHDSVWLHVEASNTAGVELYRVCDYQVVRRDPTWVPGSAYLMYKAVPQLPRLPLRRTEGGPRQRGGAGAAGNGAGLGGGEEGVVVEVPGVGRRGEDGVFVWEVAATQEPKEP